MGYEDLELVHSEQDDFKDITTLVLAVNLLKKKEDLVSEFKKKISCWQNRVSEKRPAVLKRQWNSYDQYLELYDLKYPKTGKGKTILEIAKIKFDNDSQNVQRKVKRNIKECKRLINGGYKYIR